MVGGVADVMSSRAWKKSQLGDLRVVTGATGYERPKWAVWAWLTPEVALERYAAAYLSGPRRRSLVVREFGSAIKQDVRGWFDGRTAALEFAATLKADGWTTRVVPAVLS